VERWNDVVVILRGAATKDLLFAALEQLEPQRSQRKTERSQRDSKPGEDAFNP
jgi:hypothetical protein